MISVMDSLCVRIFVNSIKNCKTWNKIIKHLIINLKIIACFLNRISFYWNRYTPHNARCEMFNELFCALRSTERANRESARSLKCAHSYSKIILIAFMKWAPKSTVIIIFTLPFIRFEQKIVHIRTLELKKNNQPTNLILVRR